MGWGKKVDKVLRPVDDAAQRRIDRAIGKPAPKDEVAKKRAEKAKGER